MSRIASSDTRLSDSAEKQTLLTMLPKVQIGYSDFENPILFP